MITSINVIDDNGKEAKIEILMRFRIEELNKEYIVYTLNDDGKKEIVPVIINEIIYENSEPRIKLIPEDEKNLVLTFYDNVRDTMIGKR